MPTTSVVFVLATDMYIEENEDRNRRTDMRKREARNDKSEMSEFLKMLFVTLYYV